MCEDIIHGRITIRGDISNDKVVDGLDGWDIYISFINNSVYFI